MADMNNSAAWLKQQLAEAREGRRKFVRLTLSEAATIVNALQKSATCNREHVEYRAPSRSDNRFFGDENNG